MIDHLAEEEREPEEVFEGTPMYKKLLFGLIGLALVTVLFGACTIQDTGGPVTGPKVSMGATTFVEKEVTVKKGETLTLLNPSSQAHIIANGTWDGATPKPASEPNAPKSANQNVQAGGSMKIGPFNSTGTFKYFCTIHGGMDLTVTVQ